MQDLDRREALDAPDSRAAREPGRRRKTSPRIDVVPALASEPFTHLPPSAQAVTTPAPPRLDLREVGEHVVGLLRAAGRADCMTLDLVLPLQEATVFLERHEAEQVLFNITRHAIDAVAKAPPAAPRVSVTMGAEISAQARANDEGGVTICHVTSNATGPAPMRRIGTGTTDLGLVVAKRLVEAAGGTLGIHHDPAAGTTFTIALPSRRPPPKSAPR